MREERIAIAKELEQPLLANVDVEIAEQEEWTQEDALRLVCSPYPSSSSSFWSRLSFTFRSDRPSLISPSLPPCQTISILPADLLQEILVFSSAHELCRMAAVCTAWKDVADHSVQWPEVADVNDGLCLVIPGRQLFVLRRKRLYLRRTEKECCMNLAQLMVTFGHVMRIFVIFLFPFGIVYFAIFVFYINWMTAFLPVFAVACLSTILLTSWLRCYHTAVSLLRKVDGVDTGPAISRLRDPLGPLMLLMPILISISCGMISANLDYERPIDMSFILSPLAAASLLSPWLILESVHRYAKDPVPSVHILRRLSMATGVLLCSTVLMLSSRLDSLVPVPWGLVFSPSLLSSLPTGYLYHSLVPLPSPDTSQWRRSLREWIGFMLPSLFLMGSITIMFLL